MQCGLIFFSRDAQINAAYSVMNNRYYCGLNEFLLNT